VCLSASGRSKCEDFLLCLFCSCTRTCYMSRISPFWFGRGRELVEGHDGWDLGPPLMNRNRTKVLTRVKKVALPMEDAANGFTWQTGTRFMAGSTRNPSSQSFVGRLSSAGDHTMAFLSRNRERASPPPKTTIGRQSGVGNTD